MNRVYIYLSGFFVCITLFSLIFFFSFKNLQYEMQEKQRAKYEEELKKATARRGGEAEGTMAPNSAMEVDTTQKAVVSEKTDYRLETYDSEKDTVKEESLEVPAELVGMDREKLADYLESYMENVSLDEYMQGLLSYEIVSFSEDKLVLRKTYRPDPTGYKFYVASINDEVVVFYSDKKTVYDYTGIDSTHLSQEERVKLNIGYEVLDLEELYGILENYSS